MSIKRRLYRGWFSLWDFPIGPYRDRIFCSHLDHVLYVFNKTWFQWTNRLDILAVVHDENKGTDANGRSDYKLYSEAIDYLLSEGHIQSQGSGSSEQFLITPRGRLFMEDGGYMRIMRHHRTVNMLNVAKAVLIIANAVAILWLTWGSFAISSRHDTGLQDAVNSANKKTDALTGQIERLNIEIHRLSTSIISPDTIAIKDTIQ